LWLSMDDLSRRQTRALVIFFLQDLCLALLELWPVEQIQERASHHQSREHSAEELV
jgi:hypothetical protein